MELSILILFILTLLGGLTVYLVPKINSQYFRLSLVFAGSYLFSITITHILPELFYHQEKVPYLAMYVLLGFFLQVIIEYFTEGVEHGHLHKSDEDHHHKPTKWIGLLTALCIHAFLEGTLLSQPQALHQHEGNNTVLIGILMHKVPAAFALMSVIICFIKVKVKAIGILLIFCMASPLGLISSNYIHENNLFTDSFFSILIALVAGNFLHISTTIFFESSPDHNLSFKKMLVASAAAIIAVFAEFWI